MIDLNEPTLDLESGNILAELGGQFLNPGYCTQTRVPDCGDL